MVGPKEPIRSKEAVPEEQDELSFSTVRRVRSFDDIVAQIQEGVSSGRLKAGDRLPNERDLRGRFGVSRSTLREALRVLEAFGIVEIRPGSAGGTFIREPDEDQAGIALEALIRFSHATADDLAEFRTSFESETAYWAAQRADDEDIAELDRLVAAVRRSAEDRDENWKVLAKLDVEFHEAIARASKNQVRVAIMLGIHRALVQTSTSIEPYASGKVRRQIAAELAAMADAVREHRADVARNLMQEHVDKFAELGRSFGSGEEPPAKKAQKQRTRKPSA